MTREIRWIAGAAGIGGALLLALFSAGGTAAYLTDQGILHNRFTVGHNTTRIEETFPDPKPLDPGTPTEIPKSAAVKNQGSVTCYIRMAVYSSCSDIGTLVLKGGDTSRWTDGEDGYYYYVMPVKPGESTTPLFTQVSFAGDGNGTYLENLEQAEVVCYEESVQASHGSRAFDNYREAWDFFESCRKEDV